MSEPAPDVRRPSAAASGDEAARRADAGAGAGEATGGPLAPALVEVSPSHRLIWGLALSLLTILGFCLYAAYEIGSLRDRQVAASERNRRDSLQLLRIQNNLSALAMTMRDMESGAEPYPVAAWGNTFGRLRVDLGQALDEERGLAPARPAGQQAQLTETVDRFWEAVDRAFALAAAGNESGALDIVRQSALPRHAELSGLVSQFLIRNTQVEDEAAAASREVYTRVIRQIYVLMALLLLIVFITGALNIVFTRHAFEEVSRVSRQMRALTWRMLGMQERLQAGVARELHDEFGQILTALTMLIGRAKGRLAAASLPAAVGGGGQGRAKDCAKDAEPQQENAVGRSFFTTIVDDLEEVEALTRKTLERIRHDARLLHPSVLDDFGLEDALCAHVLDFGKRHEIVASFSRNRPIGHISTDVRVNLFRIAQEALTNVARHSGADELWVRLDRKNERLRLEVEDLGCGMPHWGATEGEGQRSATEAGLGMIGMRERAEALGGRFEVTRGAGGGVLVRVDVPVDARMPDESAGA